MIRIVGIQHASDANREFVLLQNQGTMRQRLRGHILVSELSMDLGTLSPAMFAFPDPEMIPSGAFILLTTGTGQPRWSKSKDGALVFHTYMNRTNCAWGEPDIVLHVSNVQHTYEESRSVHLESVNR